MAKVYFRNTRTGKRFEVVRIDKAAGQIVLKGEYAEFTEPYDKARFKEMGYELEREA
jgi:hypothetical protein